VFFSKDGTDSIDAKRIETELTVMTVFLGMKVIIKFTVMKVMISL